MSDEGRAYVKGHSPYTGTTWWFHYVMGDIANAQHDYRIFISDKRLADEWPLTRAACTRARAALIAGGHLVPLSETTAPGKPREYRFVFVGAEAMARGNAPRGDAGSPGDNKAPRSAHAPRGDAGTRRTVRRVRASSADPVLLPTETELNGNHAAAAPPVPDDPCKRRAHQLTVLAFEQTPSPVTRGGFVTVLARIEEQLRAGTPVQSIERAIKAGPVTWTRDGLTTAIGKANPRQRERGNSDGDSRSLTELQHAARQGGRR